MTNLFISILIICLCAGIPALSSQCVGGKKNGIVDTACLMERVEEISDDGKFIIKAGDSHYSVNVTFTLLSVDDLTDDGTFQARIRVRTRWFDPNLSWNSSELAGKEDIIVMPAKLARWPQFIVIYDQDFSRSMVQKMGDFPVTINSVGLNEHLVEVTTLTACSLDTTYFPNDIQTCSILLAPLPMGVSGIMSFNVEYMEDTDLFDASNDWPLEKDDSYPIGVTVDQSDNDYVSMTVQMKRNSHSIDLALVEPMYVFSIITTVIYLLPPASGERIGCAITMVLTMAVTMLVVTDVLPTSDPTKADSYFTVFTNIAFAQTMILFIETIIVLAIWNSEKPIHWCLQRKINDISDEKEEKREISYKKAALRIDFSFFVVNLIVSIVSVILTIMGIASPAITK